MIEYSKIFLLFKNLNSKLPKNVCFILINLYILILNLYFSIIFLLVRVINNNNTNNKNKVNN